MSCALCQLICEPKVTDNYWTVIYIEMFFFFITDIGNQFASAGEFNKAVGYFTDAIKYNPKEFK